MPRRNQAKRRAAAKPAAAQPETAQPPEEKVTGTQENWANKVVRSPVAWIALAAALIVAGLWLLPALTKRPASTPVAGRVLDETPVPMSGCTMVSTRPTPGPTQQSLFPPVSDKDWVQGPMTASVTLIEYSDFQ